MRNQIVTVTYGDFINASDLRLSMWWEEIEAWAKDASVLPSEIAAKFKQKPSGLSMNTVHNLRKYRTRIVEQLNAENVEFLELVRVWPEGKDRVLDFDFCGMYGLDHVTGSIHVVGMSLSRLHDVPSLSPSGFAREIVHRSRSYLSARYGFAVSMPRSFMPSWYVGGVPSGGLPKEMLWDTNAWTHYRDGQGGKAGGSKCDHILRNVYGYNILNPKHLEIDIGGGRLEDWIRSGNGQHGRIEPLESSSPDKLFLWTFQEGDDQEKFLWWDYPPVVAVREKLKKFKIFLWQRTWPGIE